MRTFSSSAICVLAVGLASACSDDTSSDVGTNKAKLEAKNLYQSSTASRPTQDLCLLHGWYGDGTCDSWCPLQDPTDCTDPNAGADAGSPPIACSAIWSLPDGHCDLSDPCSKLQDADCQVGQDAGPAPVGCTAILSLADGHCDRTAPCASVQDEDCIEVAADAGSPPVACSAIGYPTDGKCEPPAGCEQNDPVDCGIDTGIICTDLRYPDDGKCEASKGCEKNDPIDCKKAVACPAIYIPKDGVCPANSPCDPDCAG